MLIAQSGYIHEWYYHGLPSRPTCLATSLACDDPSTRRYPRAVRLLPPVQTHPIRQSWQSSIAPDILRLADELDAPIQSGHVIRISRPAADFPTDKDVQVADEAAPHIVWLGVGGTQWDASEARTFVARCCGILRAHNLPNVAVEICSIGATNLAEPSFLPTPTATITRRYAQPFSIGLGMNISPVGSRDLVGSGAIFLRLGDDPQLYLLTVQHNLVSDINASLPFSTDSIDRPILLLGEGSFVRHKSALEEEIQGLGMKAERERARIKKGTGDSDELNIMEKRKRQLQELCSQLSADWAEANNRVIGWTCCYPPIRPRAPGPSFHVGLEVRYTEDWGLVRLKTERFTTDTTPNVLRLDDSSYSFFGGVRFPEDGELRLSGTRAVTESLDQPIKVVKRGATSGQTIGYASAIESFERFKLIDGRKTLDHVSWEIPVIGQPASTPFSAAGDSGSAVLDLTGRVIGIITRGQLQEEGRYGQNVDITLVTPILFVLGRIREVCGLEPRLAF